MSIKIKEVYGYLLGYDESRRYFTVTDSEGTELAVAPTQDKAEEKAQALSKRDFKRIPIMTVNAEGEMVKGEVTSLDRQAKEFWVSMEKGKNTYGSGRGKEDLKDTTSYYGNHYYEATEANLYLAQQIQAKAKAIADIKAEVEQLRTTLEKPINLEYFGMKE